MANSSAEVQLDITRAKEQLVEAFTETHMQGCKDGFASAITALTAAVEAAAETGAAPIKLIGMREAVAILKQIQEGL